MAVALLLACATLTKGPLGLLLPLLTIFGFLCLRRDFAFLKKAHPISGAVFFFLSPVLGMRWLCDREDPLFYPADP